MMSIKHKILSLAVAIGVLIPVAIASPALAFDINSHGSSPSICDNPSASGSTYCPSTSGGGTNGISGSSGIITITVNIIAIIAGAVAVIIIIVSGIRLIAGGDNPQTTNEARNMILYSLIGIVIIAISWTLVSFLLSLITK